MFSEQLHFKKSLRAKQLHRYKEAALRFEDRYEETEFSSVFRTPVELYFGDEIRASEP